MAVTLRRVQALLDPEEPDYAAAAAELGAEALPHLETLIEGDDPGLAAKAASLAGFIGGPGATEVLAKAAQSEDPRVRVAAAGAARQLPARQASAVLTPLVEDDDLGVQITAFKSVPENPTPELQAAMISVARDAEVPEILHSMIPQMEGVPPRKQQAPGDAPETPELGEMPGLEGGSGAFSEGLSADDTSNTEAEMPGLASEQPESDASGDEQEMPGLGVTTSGEMDDVDREMPGFGAS